MLYEHSSHDKTVLFYMDPRSFEFIRDKPPLPRPFSKINDGLMKDSLSKRQEIANPDLIP